MNANTATTIQPYRKIKPVLHHQDAILIQEDFIAPIINISEKIDAGKTSPISPGKAILEPVTWSMPPLVHAYFRGKDNDPL